MEYRLFNSSRTHATWDRGYLTLSVWKPLIIHDCLRELPPKGIVFYADTSTRLQEPLSANLLAAVQEIGFVGRQTTSPVAMYTHPQMAAELAAARLIGAAAAAATMSTSKLRPPRRIRARATWTRRWSAAASICGRTRAT